jgi:hypothetical protein
LVCEQDIQGSPRLRTQRHFQSISDESIIQYMTFRIASKSLIFKK